MVDVGGSPPKTPEPQRTVATPADDLELAPEEEKGESNPARPEPAKPDSPPKDSGTPLRANAVANSGGKRSSVAKTGSELESLEDTMKGPLDALIESEALAASGLDDPVVRRYNSIRPLPRSSNSAAS